jgi:hypothetical protein
VRIAGLEQRYRRHARMADRVPPVQSSRLNNFPRWETAENKAWMESAFASADLVRWSKLICFVDEPSWPTLGSRLSVTPDGTWLFASPARRERCTCGLTVAGLGRQRFVGQSPASGPPLPEALPVLPVQERLSPHLHARQNTGPRGPTRRSPWTGDDVAGSSGPPWDGAISEIAAAVSAPDGNGWGDDVKE